MKVHVDWPKQTVSLQEYLTPKEWYDGGIAETARDLANKNAESTGRLLASLVEKNILTFEEASNIAGVSGGHLE